MGFLINIFIWMIKIMFYCVLFVFYLMYYICYLVVSLIISMITCKKAGAPKKFNVNFNNNKKTSWKEDEFEKEANILGLSKEDKRIAKEEGMNPSDYIEAEENDDDELDEDR